MNIFESRKLTWYIYFINIFIYNNQDYYQKEILLRHQIYSLNQRTKWINKVYHSNDYQLISRCHHRIIFWTSSRLHILQNPYRETRSFSLPINILRSHRESPPFFARIGRGNSGTESRWNQCWNCNRRWRTVRLERGRSGEMPLTVTRGNPCRVPASIQVLSKRPSPALPPRGRSKIRLYRGNWNAADSIRKQIPSNRSLGRHLARISPHSFANVLLYVMRRFI